LQTDAGSAAFTGSLTQPLFHRRRAFSWCGPPHPLRQLILPSPDGTVAFRSPTSGRLHALVAEHVVQGRVIFPGAGYLEMASAAAGARTLQGVYFLHPLAVEAPGLVVECAVSPFGRFEVRSGVAGGAFEDGATVHCSGATVRDGTWQPVEQAAVRSSHSRPVDVSALYDGFDAVGLQYGPGYRTLTHAWGGEPGALSRLRARTMHDGTQVHPADLDDALCTSGAMGSRSDGETRLPFAVDDALLQGTRGELWAVRARTKRPD